MKCRNISCHKDLYFDSDLNICTPKVHLGRDHCFSVFVKLTLHKQYSLRKVKFKQYHYLLYLKYTVLKFLIRNMVLDVLTEIRIYPKFEVLSGKSYVDYFVMHVTMDIAGALYPEDVLSLFVKHLDDVDIKTAGEIDNNVYHASLAVYNITTDFSGRRKIYVPTYKSPDVDVLDEFDLGGSDVDNEFVGIMSDNECVVKEIKPFKKLDIVPFTEVGLNELSMYIENTFLVLQEEYLEKIFTNFEYELHKDVIYLSLEDFTFIYDIMPKDHFKNEVSGAISITSYHLTSVGSACMLFFYLL